MTMHIEYLADYPEFIPLLARWHHQAFGHFNPGATLEQGIAKLHQKLGRTTMPMTIVAVSQDRLLGSASLVAQDMSTHPELSPWIASVYVDPDYRKQGIGSKLVGRIEAEARKLGMSRIYLYTPDKEMFYTRLGWSTIKTEPYRGLTVVIMEKVLAAL
jgi:GNAT superfamily N-acetyltransferase